MQVEHVDFWSAGTRCAADLYVPEGRASGAGLVIGHGFRQTKEALTEEGRYFCEAGYTVLAIDYRTFGESDGEPRGQLFPRNQVEDFRNAITFLSRRPGVDPARIGIWGVSFGGAVVIQTAAFDRRVRAVVAQSPVVDGRRWIREMRSGHEWETLVQSLQEDFVQRYGGDAAPAMAEGFAMEARPRPGAGPAPSGPNPRNPNPVTFSAQLQKSYRPSILLESFERVIDFNPTDVIDMIAPRPILIIANGGYDQTHFVHHIQDAFKAAGEPKELAILPYDGFELYQEPGRGDAMRRAIDFFDRYLRSPNEHQ